MAYHTTHNEHYILIEPEHEYLEVEDLDDIINQILGDFSEVGYVIFFIGTLDYFNQEDMEQLVFLNEELTAKGGYLLTVSTSESIAEQLKDKEMHAVHHLGVSPIFKTPTKTNTVTTWGMDGLEELSKTVSKPMIAIGGMNISNAGKAFESGANSIAVVSAICASTDPRKAAEELKEKTKELLTDSITP